MTRELILERLRGLTGYFAEGGLSFEDLQKITGLTPEDHMKLLDVMIAAGEIEETDVRLWYRLKDVSKSEEIIQLLDAEEVQKTHLDLGEHNGVWYYGFIMPGSKMAIVTSDGRVLMDNVNVVRDSEGRRQVVGENEIKKLFDYAVDLGTIAPIIAKETVKKFYLKQRDGQLINPKELYVAIRNKVLYYMDFAGQDEIADVLTCWIIGTYCYPLFYWFPHILINAPSGSGKSKCLTIIMYLSFRGFDIGAAGGVTPAQLFRTLEANRGTIILDEFEQIDNDTTKLVNQILNAAASKDAYVIRTEQINKKWVAWKFPIFCPKAVGNISGINPTSLSRFIPFKWLKTASEKGKRKPERAGDKKSFEPIRESLYLFILENWRAINDIYNNLDIPQLRNRESDNWLPLFSVARFIDSCDGDIVNAEQQLTKYLNEYKQVEIETQDNTEEFFRLLHENLSSEQAYFTPKDIAAFPDIAELLSYLKSPAHWIGKKLTLYKFTKGRTGDKRRYLLSKSLVKQIIDVYYGTELMSHNDTNVTNDSNDTNDTKQMTLGDVCDVISEREREGFAHHKDCNNPEVKAVNPDKPDYLYCFNCGVDSNTKPPVKEVDSDA